MRSPADVVTTWSVGGRVSVGRREPRGGLFGRRWKGRLRETQDNEEIIERVAALDIGKAELVMLALNANCCLECPPRRLAGALPVMPRVS
jgi:hypothetical protein